MDIDDDTAIKAAILRIKDDENQFLSDCLITCLEIIALLYSLLLLLSLSVNFKAIPNYEMILTSRPLNLSGQWKH